MAFAAANYSYDSAGRLVKVDYGAGGSITYTYDKAGNLLSRTVVSAASAAKASQRVPARKSKPRKTRAEEGSSAPSH